jgi:hypothetical protein
MRIHFTNCRTPQSVGELGLLERRQLREAGIRYDGRDLPAAARLAEGEDPGSFRGYLELWDVEEDGQHRYDAFMYMADSGTVFRRGTVEVVAEVVQCGFEGRDRAFAHWLEQAYRRAHRD